jgi:hypothetical protein
MSHLVSPIMPGGCTDPTPDLKPRGPAVNLALAEPRFLGPPIRTERLRLPGGDVVEVRVYVRPRRMFLNRIRRLLGRPVDTAERYEAPLVVARGVSIGGQALYDRLTNDPRVTRL